MASLVALSAPYGVVTFALALLGSSCKKIGKKLLDKFILRTRATSALIAFGVDSASFQSRIDHRQQKQGCFLSACPYLYTVLYCVLHSKPLVEGFAP